MNGRDDAPAHRGASHFLVRHRRLVLSLMTLGVAIGIALAVVAPSTYRSEVGIVITRLTTPGQDPAVALADEARFVNAAVVRDAVRSSIPDAPDAVEVDIEPSTTRLHITAHDDDPDKALRLARAWASAYIGERRNVLIERLTEQSTLIDAELNRLVTDIGTARLATDDDEVSRLEARRDRLAADQTAIGNDLAALSRTAGAEVVQMAAPPEGRSGVALAPAMGLGAALGAGLGAGIGVVLDRRRRHAAEATEWLDTALVPGIGASDFTDFRSAVDRPANTDNKIAAGTRAGPEPTTAALPSRSPTVAPNDDTRHPEERHGPPDRTVTARSPIDAAGLGRTRVRRAVDPDATQPRVVAPPPLPRPHDGWADDYRLLDD